MTINNDIDPHLSAYMAPIEDNGFSDAVMAKLAPQSALPLALETETSFWSRWAGPIISLCLGGAAALIWNALIGPVDFTASPDLDGLLASLSGSSLYLSFGIAAILAWAASEALSRV